MTNSLPVVALTLGDPAGIGPELIAKLLSQPSTIANIVLVGDPWLWEKGQKIAGKSVKTQPITQLNEVRKRQNTTLPAFLAVETISPDEVHDGVAEAAGGRSVLQVLDLCMDATLAGDLDAICFAPLNKHAMKLGGLRHEDELHHFADYLKVKTYVCEFNTLGTLWTSRISSHIPLKEAAHYVQKPRIKDAARLIYQALQDNGVARPRVGIAGFNPHNGDGGICGREEIETIIPTVEELQAEGLNVLGPYPADTIFLKARNGDLDAIVTMYHDQGQIAIKLMGFSQGVTVQGGLPIPITTPAHGTAYDIVGQGQANVGATHHAFTIAARMGAARLLGGNV